MENKVSLGKSEIMKVNSENKIQKTIKKQRKKVIWFNSLNINDEMKKRRKQATVGKITKHFGGKNRWQKDEKSLAFFSHKTTTTLKNVKFLISSKSEVLG